MNELTEFEKIEEIDTATYDYEIVNKCLRAGWKLFATRTEAQDEPEGHTESTVYCLGWSGYGEAIDAKNMTTEEIDAELKRREEEAKKMAADVF